MVYKMKKKILLIEPPFYRLHNNSYSLDRVPFALSYLAGAILQDTNWDVKTYNADFVPSYGRKKISYLSGKGFDNYISNLNDLSKSIWNEIESVIEDYQPDIVGISVKSTSYISSTNVAKICKKINKDIKVIFGGPHPTMAKKEIFDNKYFDISVVGEGEKTITELLNNIEENKPLDEINGIIFRKNEEVIQTSPRGFMNNFDHLRFPHIIAKETLHNFSKYPANSFKYIFASRGCPYNCKFCASKEIWTKKVRFRSIGNVVAEIKEIKQLGVTRIHFDDDTFGVSKKYIAKLCKKIEVEVPGIKWSCEIRANLIDNESVLNMKEAGCETIQVGFESGNNELLSEMGKGLTVEEILEACDIIKKHKIELQTFFLVGYPFETEEMLKDTIKMMKKSKSDKILYSIFTPYPYTEIYDFCESKGLIKDDFDPTLFNHQSPLNCFSMFISPKRFRKLAGKIERMIDRRNLLNRLFTIFSFKGFPRLAEIVNDIILQKFSGRKLTEIKNEKPDLLATRL